MNLSVIAQSSLAEASQEYLAACDNTRKWRHRIASYIAFLSLTRHGLTAAVVGILSLQQEPDLQLKREEFSVEKVEDHLETGYL